VPIVFIVGLNLKIKYVQHVEKYSNQSDSKYTRHFLCEYKCSFFLLSLRSDVRTDSLVDMIKKQQAKTNELAQIYHEQQQDD
jgi:hypothetical protein